MARRQLVLLWFIFALTIIVLGPQRVISQEIDGILYIYDSKDKVHIVKIDLTNPHIHLQTVLANNTGQTTEQVDSMARKHNAVVAINGDYFGNTGVVLVEGTTYVNGVKIWENIWRTYLAISQDNQVAIVRPGDQPNFAIYNAIGGGPWIVWDGKDQWERSSAPNCPPGEKEKSIINGECYAKSFYWDKGRRPQSAIGITRDGRTLILAVAPASSPKKMAKLLTQYGAWTAMKLDSGGSSTLFYNGRVLHTEGRAVANALVVLHDAVKNPIQSPPISTPPPSLTQCKASPKISVKPKSGAPGTPFTVKWTGFSDNGTLTSHLQKPDGSEYPTKTFTVDRKGKAEFIIDSSSFVPGQYNLWAEDTCTGKRTKTVSFTIKGSTPPAVQPPTPSPINTPPQIIDFNINPSPATLGSPVVIVGVVIDWETQNQKELSYLWSFGNGETSTERETAVTYFYREPGLFNVCLTVTDPQGLQAQKCQQLQVIGESGGQPPSPGPGPSPPPQPIDSDNDGIPDNQDQCPYQWGPPPTGCPATTQPPSPPPSNQPPWAQITVFPTTVNVGEWVTVQVVAYGDPEGQPLVFDYDFGDGTVISSPASGENHSYSSPGTYSVRAKVRDSQGAFSYTNSVTVTVMGSSLPPPSFPPFPPSPPSTPMPQSPVARFTMGGESLLEGYKTASENEILYLDYAHYESGVKVDFSASNSFDPDGAIVKYEWFINGTPVSNSRDFSFVLDANQHLILLRVTDNMGLQSEVGATIIVEEVIIGDGLQTEESFKDVSVYNTSGKLIYQIEEIPPHRDWFWDMRDSDGTRVPNGVYLAVITVRDLDGYPIRREVRKIIVLR